MSAWHSAEVCAVGWLRQFGVLLVAHLSSQLLETVGDRESTLPHGRVKYRARLFGHLRAHEALLSASFKRSNYDTPDHDHRRRSC